MASIRELDDNIKSKLRSSVIVNTIAQSTMELVMNSLDAKSSAIAIRLDLSKFKIQVIDNGVGISRSDLNLVGLRYMTSKCHNLEDLKKCLKTYGYRGEALASVCELSRSVVIESREQSCNKSYSKTIRGLQHSKIQIVKCRPSTGTTVIVDGFLSNLPIRQQCIKANEFEAIKKNLEQLKIIHPHVSISLRNELNGKLLMDTQKHSDVIAAFHSLYPEIDIDKFSMIKVTKGRVSVEGLLHKESNQTKKYQFIYANKRPIINADMQKVIANNYAKYITEKNTYPIYIILIKCPCNDIDLLLDSKKNLIQFKNLDKITRCLEKMFERFLAKNKIHIEKNKQNANAKSTCGVSLINGVVKGIGLKRQTDSTSDYGSPEKAMKFNLKDPEIIVEKKDDIPIPNLIENPLFHNSPSSYVSEQYFEKVAKLPNPINSDLTQKESEGKKLIMNKFMQSVTNYSNFKTNNKRDRNQQKSHNSLSNEYSPKFHTIPNKMVSKSVQTSFIIMSPPKICPLNSEDKYANICKMNHPDYYPNNFYEKPYSNNAEFTPIFENNIPYPVDKNIITPIYQDKFLERKRSFKLQVNSQQSTSDKNYLTKLNDKQNMTEDCKLGSLTFLEMTITPKKLRKQSEKETSKYFTPSQESTSKFQQLPKENMSIAESCLENPTVHQFFNQSEIKRNFPFCQNPINLNISKEMSQTNSIYPNSLLKLNDTQHANKLEHDGLKNRYLSPSDRPSLNNFFTQSEMNEKLPFTQESNQVRSKNDSEIKITLNSEAKQQTMENELELDKKLNPHLNTQSSHLEPTNQEFDYFFIPINQPENKINQFFKQSDWIKKINEFGTTYFVNEKTIHSDATINFGERFDFIPKGLSPILSEKGQVDQSLNSSEKKNLHAAILDSYEDELITIKWKNYIENNDPNGFFENLYKEKAKLIEGIIPNVSNANLPKTIKKYMESQAFEKNLFENLQVIGQVDCKFIVTIDVKMKLLFLFDQHAVHERVRLELLLNDYKETLVKTPQKHTIFLDYHDLNLMQSASETITVFGFIHEFFTHGIFISEVPQCVWKKSQKNKNLDKLLQCIIREILGIMKENNGNLSRLPKLLQSIINMEACRGAIKFGDKLTLEECIIHIQNLSFCDLPFQCAHGRPTLTPLMYYNNMKSNNDRKTNLRKLLN